MSAADEAPGVGHLPCAHVWPLQMRSRRQRGLLSQQRPDQLADYSGCAPGEVLGGRARVDGLLDVVALPPLAGMSAAVVRVGAAPSSTRARAPLRSFAMVASSEASQALHLVERAPSRSPSTHDAPFAHNGFLERARRPWKMR